MLQKYCENVTKNALEKVRKSEYFVSFGGFLVVELLKKR